MRKHNLRPALNRFDPDQSPTRAHAQSIVMQIKASGHIRLMLNCVPDRSATTMFKTILVHLRGTNADRPTLAAAYLFARPFAAHLESLHIRPDFGAMMSRITLAGNDDNPGAVAEIIEATQRAAAQNAQRAADAHMAFCDKEQILKF
jgi:hypothetical protein